MKWIPLFFGLFTATVALAQSPAPAAVPKLYAVRLTKGPAWDETRSPNEQTGMREHSANIARMRREGVLVLGARFGELGLLVLRGPDEAAVNRQLAPDPAIAGGVFKAQIDAYAPFAHGTTAWLVTPEAVVLRAYLDACDRLDAAEVTALCAEGFTWYNVEAEKIAPEVQGRAALHDWPADYYRNIPSARCEFLSIEQTGAFLSVRERTVWENPQGERMSQQAIGVYEVRDGLIQRVWYYPSVKDTPAK